MSEKHFLVQGALCQCSQGAKPDKLVVLSHSKEYINDAESSQKLIATTLDIGLPFQSKTFGACAQMSGSACVPAVTSWINDYPKIKLSNGGNILTEESKAICSVSGTPCISVLFHGQVAAVASAHFDDIEVDALALLNPAAPPPTSKKSELPKVKNIKLTFENRKEDKTFQSSKNGKGKVQVVVTRKDEPMKLEVENYYNTKTADTSKVGWKIMKAHDFKEVKQAFPETGPTLSLNFDRAGKYRVVGFGSSDEKKQNDTACSLDIEVKENTLKDDFKLDTVSARKKNGQYFVRRGASVTIEALYEFEPTEEERKRVHMVLTDEAGNVLQKTEKGTDKLTFTPANTAATYIVTAIMAPVEPTGHETNISKNILTEPNGVVAVTCPQGETVRPGTTMVFTASELTYNTLVEDFETEAIKWQLNGRDIGTGRSLTLDGKQYFSAPGNYVVEAYVVKANAWNNKKNKPASPDEKDDWRFKVKYNEVTGIEGPTTWVAGKKYDFRAVTLMPYDAKQDGDINWKTPNGTGLNYGEFLRGAFLEANHKSQVIASLAHNAKPITLDVAANYAVIKKWSFAYFNKDTQRSGSIGLKTNLHLVIEGLTNEEVEIHLWEHRVEYNTWSSDTYKMVPVTSFKKTLQNGELFLEIASTEKSVWDTLNYDEKGQCRLFFTVKKTGAMENIEFAPAAVKQYKTDHALSGHFFPVTNNKDIGVYLILTSKREFLEAFFVNDKYEHLYKIIKYGDEALGLVKTTGFKPGEKVQVALVENLENDENRPQDPLANTYGEISVNDDGTLKIQFKTSKEALGAHNKYIKDLSGSAPRLFYMALYHEKSLLLYPTDVGDDDITYAVAEYFKIAKAVGEVTKQKDPSKFALEKTSKVIKRNYFYQLKIAEDTSQNELLSGLAPIVLGEPLETEKGEHKTCPRCNEPITLDEMKQLFPDCKDLSKLTGAMDAYNTYMKDFKMNTCWNKAHFFAQARVEVGTSFNIKEENFNYYWEELLNKFGAFNGTEEGRKKAKEWGRAERKGPSVSRENQKNIANWAYGPGTSTGKQLGNTQEGDGWRFRGRHMVQLTGRVNYTHANTYTQKYFNVEILSDAGADKVGTDTKVGVVACMAYWTHKRRNIHLLANGNRDVDKVSEEIGNHKEAWRKKKKAFDEVTSKIFTIDDCQWGKAPKITTGRAPWMEVALNVAKEMKGCEEDKEPMYGNAKKYLRYCGNNADPTDGENGPWCAAFMNWCIGESKYSHAKSDSSLAPLGASTGKKYKSIDTPIYGCLVVYKHTNTKKWKGHTGFLYGKTPSGRYILLGGNQDNAIRFSSYGEYTSKSKTKKLYGFYIPVDYEVKDTDLLTDSDVYESAESLNEQYGIITKKSSGKTD